jgi:hypothetical protein
VLVGRSELLKPAFERELLSKGENLAEEYGTDRFFGPYQERVRQLTQVSMSAKVPR